MRWGRYDATDEGKRLTDRDDLVRKLLRRFSLAKKISE